MSLMYKSGENTIIKGIKRLAAGHFNLRSETHDLKSEQWWNPRFKII